MTDKEMAEAIQGIITLLDGVLDPNNAEPWRDVGKAQGLLGNIIAAPKDPPLEAPVLAEVEGRAWVWRDGVILFETSGNLSLIRDADPHSYDGNAVDVTVTIRGRGEVPEPPAISSSIR